MRSISADSDHLTFAALLDSAVHQPGRIHEAYFAFHNYSVGNQLLALAQCHARGIAPGPLATFQRWKERGRHVRKGEKALMLCMPVQWKRTGEQGEPGPSPDPTTIIITTFIYRRNWFVLAQTEGASYQEDPVPTWEKQRALQVLGVEEIPFDHFDGNIWGFARGRQVAISPLSPLPVQTLLHELAHVVLGHTDEHTETEGPRTPRTLREVEAEGVAFICGETLQLPGQDYSRGYLQHWLRGQEIPERSAQRIFKAADTILRAGREVVADQEEQ